MQSIYQWMAAIQMTIFLLAPLLVPLGLKRYVWFSFVAIGYMVYFLWRFSSGIGIGDLRNGFGRFFLHFLAAVSLSGYLLQKLADRYTQQDREE